MTASSRQTQDGGDELVELEGDEERLDNLFRLPEPMDFSRQAREGEDEVEESLDEDEEDDLEEDDNDIMEEGDLDEE